MAPLPLRPRVIPQCSACLRSYAWSSTSEPLNVAKQQIRSKSTKVVNTSNTVPVRLLKDVKTFGRRGAIVPISHGQMRNDWFPRRTAEYVTVPELKTLRLKNVPMERDFDYSTRRSIIQQTTADLPGIRGASSTAEMVDASMFQKKPVEPKKLSPERSVELLELFVKDRLDFYRQPIIEEAKEPEPEPVPEPAKKAPRSYGMGIGAELMAARQHKPTPPPKPAAPVGPQAIYGSVSTHDILMAIRAAMKENEEAGRVVLGEEDVKFVDLPEHEGSEAGRVKHVGEFAVEVKPKGADNGVRINVRVNAQEVA